MLRELVNLCGQILAAAAAAAEIYAGNVLSAARSAGGCCEALAHALPVNQLVHKGGHVVGPVHITHDTHIQWVIQGNRAKSASTWRA